MGPPPSFVIYLPTYTYNNLACGARKHQAIGHLAEVLEKQGRHKLTNSGLTLP